MGRYLPLLALMLILGYALYNATLRSQKPKPTAPGSPYTEHIRTHRSSHAQEELDQVRSDAALKQYIIDVINHGSSQLHFKKDEIMEAGFASKEDAEKIACFVMSLSGRKCDKPYPADAAAFYTSICGGCHGHDGRGTNGAYPDLTRNPLLGIELREKFLRSRVAP